MGILQGWLKVMVKVLAVAWGDDSACVYCVVKTTKELTAGINARSVSKHRLSRQCICVS